MKALAFTALTLGLTLGAGIAIASGLDENVMAPGGPGVFKHQGPVATIESYAAFNLGHARTDFFFAGDGRYVARRAEDRAGGKDAAVRWADSQTCPALNAVLADLQQLKAPVIELPGFPHAVKADLIMDGVSYHLWTTAGRFDGGRAQGAVEMAGNVDSPLAKWSQSADARLKDCWGDARPAEQ